MNTEGTHQQAHATTRTYLSVAAILFVITATEFGIVYLKDMEALILPVLFILSAIKFFMVAAFFMHLKFDSKYFTWAFVTGLGLAIVVTIALVFVHLA